MVKRVLICDRCKKEGVDRISILALKLVSEERSNPYAIFNEQLPEIKVDLCDECLNELIPMRPELKGNAYKRKEATEKTMGEQFEDLIRTVAREEVSNFPG